MCNLNFIAPHTSSPRATVVIPAFNAARTIAEAIHSVRAQTFRAAEVIVVDDSSTDETLHVVRQCAGDAQIITMPRNAGLSAALNRALDLISAPYLVQLDADDWLEPTALERVVDVLENSPSVVAVFANPIIHYPDGCESRVSGHAMNSAADAIAYRPQQVPRAYRVAALKAIGGWPTDDAAGGRYYEDRRILLRLADVGVVRHLDEWLYHVRRRGDSLSVDPIGRIAKFAILTSEANRLGRSLDVTHRGLHLRAEFVRRRSSPPRHPWSVVIPFGGRAELLSLTLRSWIESDWAASGSEILVVGASPSSREPVPRQFKHRIRIIECDTKHGPAWARNRGARRARHATLFFADSDHIVPPDILGVHQWYHERTPAPSLVAGGAFGRRVFTCFRPSEIGSEPTDRFLEVIRHHPRHEEIAAAVARDDYLTIADEQTSNLWHTLQQFTFVDEAELRWADLLLQQVSPLTPFPLAGNHVPAVNLSIAANAFFDLGGFDEYSSPTASICGVRTHLYGLGVFVALEAETYHQVHGRDLPRPIPPKPARNSLSRQRPDVVREFRFVDE